MFRRSHVLTEIQTLDPVKDHQRIALLSCRTDFPFDTTRALELALFRTFAVPSIAALLDKTGEFQERAQKRYDDTDIIVSTLVERGYDSERGQAAADRRRAAGLVPLLARSRPAHEHQGDSGNLRGLRAL
jgi:hypothetical protein